MIWLGIGLLVSLHFLLIPLLLSVWRMSAQVTRITDALRAFDRPEYLTQPSPEPGTSWTMTDRELAAMERKMQDDSNRRATTSTSLRGFKTRTPA